MSKHSLRNRLALKMYVAVSITNAAIPLLHAFIPDSTLVKLTLSASTLVAAAILSKQWEKLVGER